MGWVKDELERSKKVKELAEERLRVQRENDQVARKNLSNLWKNLVETVKSDADELERTVPGIRLQVTANEEVLAVTRTTNVDPLLKLVLDRNELTINYSGIVNGTFRVGLSEWNDPQLLGQGGIPMSLPKASETMLKPVVQLLA